MSSFDHNSSQVSNKTFRLPFVPDGAQAEMSAGQHQRLVLANGQYELIVRYGDGVIKRFPVTVFEGSVIA